MYLRGVSVVRREKQDRGTDRLNCSPRSTHETRTTPRSKSRVRVYSVIFSSCVEGERMERRPAVVNEP